MSQTLGNKFKELAARSDEQTKARVAALEERIRALEAKLAAPPTRSGEP